MMFQNAFVLCTPAMTSCGLPWIHAGLRAFVRNMTRDCLDLGDALRVHAAHTLCCAMLLCLKYTFHPEVASEL